MKTTRIKKLKLIIGYAYVVGDILHEGHLLALENCRALCDKLIVGVLTDKATMEKKHRPVIGFRERLRIVKSLKPVDAAVAQKTYSPMSNVHIIKPDILFESDSHARPGDNPYGRVQVMPYFPIQSSTRIKNKIKNNQPKRRKK